jgi:predicted secreted hydrolase
MNDKTDIMLYALRDSTGRAAHRAGTWIDERGNPDYLPGQWTADVKRRWKSPATGIEYPIAWEVRIPSRSVTLHVEAIFPEQENRTALPGGIHYWEGVVRVRDGEGREVGIGYVEMTGYGEGNRPPL